MEGQSSLTGSMIMEGLNSFQDLQGAMQLHHQQDPNFYQPSCVVQVQPESVFPLRWQYMEEQPLSYIDYNEDQRGKNLLMDCAIPGVDEHYAVEGIRTPWRRIKWTEEMVKLLIYTVSYIRQFALSNVGNGRNEPSFLQKIGKWKVVSKVMVERGYRVSPQQCEDKFNNLNKTYKKLNDVLGRGMSCKVVENPKILDEIDIPEGKKDNAKKILSSKQLFFEQMCSYHSGNQLCLPHDPDLQRSLQLALSKKLDYDKQEQDPGAYTQDNETEDSNLKSMDYNGILEDHSQHALTDLEGFHPEGSTADGLWEQWVAFRSCRLKLQRLQVNARILRLENRWFKWQRICWRKDRELIRMRLENERLKIENERIELELKYKEMRADYDLTV